MKSFFVLIFSFSSIFAQYTFNDSLLVRTTFLREFDRSIINEYLNSDNPVKIRAALLTISNSKDTTFIKELTELPFSKFPIEMAFTLGSLGPSTDGTRFLLDQLEITSDQNQIDEIYRAIGKIATLPILEMILLKESFPMVGKELAIAQFYMRNISTDSNIENIFFSNRLSLKPKKRELENLLWSIYRFGGIEGFEDEFKDIVLNTNNNIQTKLYALGCLRRNNSFPFNLTEVKELLTHSDWRIICESYKTLASKKHNTKDEIQLYLDSFSSAKNLNAKLQGAISLKDFKSQSLLKYKKNIYKLYSNEIKENAIRGEMLISYLSIFPEEVNKIHIDALDPNLQSFYLRAFSNDTLNVDYKFSELKKILPNLAYKLQPEFTSAFLSIQDYYTGDKEYSELFHKVLDFYSPASLGIISYSLSDKFIESNKKILLKKADELITEKLNDANYSESLVLYFDLIEKVDSNYFNSTLVKIEKSKIVSVANFASLKLGNEPIKNPDEEKVFEQCWENAFSAYSIQFHANDKNAILLKLRPDMAPISVGNFVKLSKEGFFDNVIFHRVVPNFVIQTGDSTGTGWGGPGYEIKSEVSWLNYKTGIVGMASAGRDTEGSQWFIMHSDMPHLDGRYTIFGELILGKETVNNILPGDKISGTILNIPIGKVNMDSYHQTKNRDISDKSIRKGSSIR